MSFAFRPSLLLLASLAIGAHAQTKDIAITGARIEVGDGKILASGTIVIHDGKIAAIGESIPTPDGADVFDAKGLVVYPGFIDACNRSGLKLPTAPAAEHAPDARTTAPASMWHGNRAGIRSDILAYKVLNLKTLVKDDYKAGVTTALLTPGSGPIAGVATIVDYTETGNVLVPQAATELSFRNGGSGGGGGFGGSYPGTLFGVIALLRQTLADAQYYAAQDAPAKKDDALENLRPLITGKLPALFSADSAREIVRATRIANEFSLKMIVLSGREAYRDIDLLKAKNLSVVVSLDLGIEPSDKIDSTNLNYDGPPQAVLDERHDTWVEHSQNIKKLSEAGIPIALSSIGLTGGVDDFLESVRKVIATGVPRDVVLKAITSESANVLGIADKVGTIEPGKIANLAIFTGDFDKAKSEVQTVFVEGKRIDVKKAGTK
jgi:imidazolonepropionase-like amidohydrolase